VYTTGSYLPSDATLKTNIDSIGNCSSILCRLKPRTFTYAANSNINLPAGTHYGLIAQDVQSILPNLVKTIVKPEVKDSTGRIIDSSVSFKAVNYTEIVPILVKGYQDEKATIDSLKHALASMQSCLDRVCSHHAEGNSNDSSSTVNVQNITLSSATAAILYQNTPNPFTVGTKINYFLPEGTTGATMLFFDMYGNKLKEVELNQAGLGTINIAPDNLKDGVYSYSLIINGQVIDTKKMILAK
ncbi:MAG TPA: tail fiber domain-containing protein, partial [Bacteroidia bacterium]|nr:tail fiber domain-containing protein [Bacteroidia bacterium]